MIGLLLAIFLGWAGGYRFYKGQKGLGIAYLLTVGLFGFGWMFDVIVALLEFIKSFQKPAACPEPVIDTDASVSEQVITSISPTFYLHSSKDTEKNISQIRDRFIVIDTETTGVNQNYDRMISLAAVIYEHGKPIQEFYTLINQPVSIPASATKVNGITNEMLKDAPSEHDVCKSFLEFCGDAIFSKTLFVAYNSQFDTKIIKLAMERYGFAGNIRHFDVLSYARQKLPELANHKQTTVADRLGIDSSGAHNALNDCHMCANILLKLIDM